MAIDYTDPTVQDSGDWFTQNAPMTTGDGTYTPPDPPPYLAPGTTPNPTPTTTTTPTTTASRTDDAAIRAKVAQWAAMPGADPSLAKDPDYWVRRIIETGGLGSDNEQYWQDASVGPTAFFNNPNREQGGQQAPSPYGSFQNAPAPYVGQTWQGGDYANPSAADYENSPYYQARMDAMRQGMERSAAAKGTVLNGGFQVSLARKLGELAGAGYENYDQNAFRNYQSRYGQFRDASGDARTDYALNTTTQRNSQNDLWNHLNDLYSTGAGLAGGSYKPGPQL